MSRYPNVYDRDPGESYTERTVSIPLLLKIRTKTYHHPKEEKPWSVCVGPGPMPKGDDGIPSETSKTYKDALNTLVARIVKAANKVMPDSMRLVIDDSSSRIM